MCLMTCGALLRCDSDMAHQYSQRDLHDISHTQQQTYSTDTQTHTHVIYLHTTTPDTKVYVVEVATNGRRDIQTDRQTEIVLKKKIVILFRTLYVPARDFDLEEG